MEMERGAWTDSRLDDRFDQIDRRFDRVDAEIRDMRVELRGEIAELRTILIRFNAGIMVGLLGVIAAILASGA